MTDMQKDRLSAFLDGEIESSAEAQQTIDWLLKDEAAKESWSDLCANKDVLHGTERRASSGFSAGVMAALDAEPTILLPAAKHALKQADKPVQKRSAAVSFLKPAAGLAVAATVAAVTVFSVDSLNTSTPNTNLTTAAITPEFNANLLQASSSQAISQTAIMPVTFTGTYDANDRTYWSGSDEAMQDELNGYLANHVDYANPGGYQSMMPYVRLAGYDSNQ